MKLYIKYMVSRRCKMLVQEVLEKLRLKYLRIDIGIVETIEDYTPSQLKELKEKMLQSGLELMEQKEANLIKKIEETVTEMVHSSHELPKTGHPDYLSKKVGTDYANLASLFSETKGITIEKFIDLQVVEKIKEILLYDELKLSEISGKLSYKSAAQVSQQVKKITGLTPSFYKNIKEKRNRNLRHM